MWNIFSDTHLCFLKTIWPSLGKQNINDIVISNKFVLLVILHIWKKISNIIFHSKLKTSFGFMYGLIRLDIYWFIYLKKAISWIININLCHRLPKLLMYSNAIIQCIDHFFLFLQIIFFLFKPVWKVKNLYKAILWKIAIWIRRMYFRGLLSFVLERF